MTLLLQRKIRRRTEGVGHRRMEQLWTLVGATQVVMQRQEFGAGGHRISDGTLLIGERAP
jgi:hypothetical protein